MSNCFTSRGTSFFTIVAIAAIGLACSASAARADLAKMLQKGEISKVHAPLEVLPPARNPRPFRQGLMAACDDSVLGSPNGCVMNFDAVPNGRLLQIDKLNCVVNAGTAILFNSQIKVNGARIMGFVQPPFEGTNGGVATGPFYFKAGERPVLVATGAAATDRAICSISGTIAQTN